MSRTPPVEQDVSETSGKDVSEISGKGLQSLLVKLVNNNWKQGTKYQFYITKDQRTLAFSIEANPTRDQTGNGRVTFGRNNNLTAPTWSELRDDVLDPQFPEKRTKFLKTSLKKADFDKKSTQANVLLLFEVARRRFDETFYALFSTNKKKQKKQPIYTWENADDAIEAVMKTMKNNPDDDETYAERVSLMRVVVALKKSFVPFCIYGGLKVCWAASTADLSLSLLLLSRHHIRFCLLVRKTHT